jgi:hypothetical protein
MLLALFFFLPSIAPRYFLTLDNRLSLLTPQGFALGQLYDFTRPVSLGNSAEARAASRDQEMTLPRPDKKSIVFKYPEVVTLGRPTYLSSEITQSVDFTIAQPPANGLIQIWVLNTSMDEFLETSKSCSTFEYLSFSSQKKENALSTTLWDYTFKSGERTVRGLEAFMDDKPYMYRISVFLNDKDYNEAVQTLFDNMVKSVKVIK